MKRYRLYEIAKELNIDSKIVIEKARSVGLELKSHSSSVSEEEKDLIVKAFSESHPTEQASSVRSTNITSSGAIIRKKSKSVNLVESEKTSVSSVDSTVQKDEVEIQVTEVSAEKPVETEISEKKSNPFVSQIKVLGKLDVLPTSPRANQSGLQEIFEQSEKSSQAEGARKVLRFKEAKSFVPTSPVQLPTKIEKREQKKDQILKQKTVTVSRPREVKVYPVMTVGEFSLALNVKASDVIHKLLSYGETKTINDVIDQDTMLLLADEYNVILNFQSTDEQEVFPDIFSVEGKLFEKRPPVVTVMGHVDHGKTTLLDALRKTSIAAKEVGGITQHIGAYTVENRGRLITFIDTPGHEAFTEIRSRGAKVTDIAVLVVAADDGVMPQTLEAISHAKQANVPIIVAINKIDKPDVNPEAIKTRLAEEGLVPEEWGGETIYVPISALKNINLDKLLDSINLLADLLELKYPVDVPARCYILEAKLDRGRGWVATVIPKKGVLKHGDYFVCGLSYGRVRLIINSTGETLKELPSGIPGEVSGFTEQPEVGEEMIVVKSEARAKELVEFRKKRVSKTSKGGFSLTDFSKMAKEERSSELRLIIKADTQGSVDALIKSLSEIQADEIGVKIVHSGVGPVNESDVKLAKAAEAVIIAFNSNVDTRALSEAESKGVEIRRYKIIYECLEDIRLALEGLLGYETVFEERGVAEVRQVFESSKFGRIAGCFVVSGSIRRNFKVKVIRNENEIFFGEIKSIRRFKDDVSEVQQGYECGILLNDFNDLKEGDLIVAVEEVQKSRTLK